MKSVTKKSHIVEVSHLVKRYNKTTVNAVDDISFYVEEGAFFSLLGPNGAGKTTTISILTTILSRTGGDVSIAGYDVEASAAAVRQNIGVIFQNPSLDMNLTAEENIRFHANLYHLFPYMPTFSLMSNHYKQNVMALATVVGLEKDMFKPVKSLSGGMKRKLEIIRSLMHQPKILFLDEPTTGLDPVSRQNLWKYLQEIRRKEETTIFLTTHYLEEAEASDYLCIIDDGKIVAQGSPTEIKDALIENYMVVDAIHRQALRKELTQLQYHFTGNGPFKIDLKKKSPHDVIKSIETSLNKIDIHSPTLEDAYVEIITKHHEQS